MKKPPPNWKKPGEWDSVEAFEQGKPRPAFLGPGKGIAANFRRVNPWAADERAV
jgi:hypothetical protein